MSFCRESCNECFQTIRCKSQSAALKLSFCKLLRNIEIFEEILLEENWEMVCGINKISPFPPLRNTDSDFHSLKVNFEQ